MTTLRPERLDVYYGDALVGFVHDSAPLAFEYAPGWLSGPQRMALAAIPRQDGRQATREVQAFFENLLPEGELRDYLATQRKASTLFSLLLEVAGDTAGGFVLVAHGQTPAAPRYEATSWEAIVMRAASLCGLPTAEVFYEPHTASCVVRRFDRQLRPDGMLARLVQYDLCQLEGTLSERK